MKHKKKPRWFATALICAVAMCSSLVAVSGVHLLDKEWAEELVELEECESIAYANSQQREKRNKSLAPDHKLATLVVLRVSKSLASRPICRERDYLNGLGTHLRT